MKPTLHVTNWSSKKLHGPGRKLTIMAKPRAWEHGDGRVPALTPRAEDLEAVRGGTIDFAEYKRRFERRIVTIAILVPGGGLQGIDRAGGNFRVADGDTLCCACSREAAARGECHRVWAAEALARAGWRVILDGKELP
jgi:hypothetical protein